MKTLSNKYTFLVLIFFFFTNLCVTAQKDGVVTVQSNEKIKNIINKKKAYNKNLKKIEGFKIQLFYGEEKGAYEIRDKFSSLFPDIPVEIKHANPDWKVWAGAFRTQLEADRVIKEIKEAQFNAFVFATKINI